MGVWPLLAVLTSWAMPASSEPSAACATTALRDLPSFAQASTGILQRPDGLSGRLSAAMVPVRVHHAAGRLELATLALDEAVAAWRVQVDGAGFAPPLSDDVGFDDEEEAGAVHEDVVDGALDIYLAPLPPGIGAVTVSGRDVDDDPRHDRRPTFLVIDPSQSDEVVAAAVHHEFQHALQFAIDARESAMWFESTAVAFEVRGRPDVTAWQLAVPTFQKQARAPLSTNGQAFFAFGGDSDLRYEYGAGLFPLFLDDVYGSGDGAVLRELWVAAAGHDDGVTGNDGDGDRDRDRNRPDWLSALPAVLGVSFADLLLEFTAWRALAPPLSVPAEGPAAYSLPGTTALRGQRVLLERLSGTARTPSASEGPFVGGCHITLASQSTAAASTPLFVRASSLAGRPLGAVILLVKAGEVSFITERGNDGEAVALDTIVEPGAEVVVAVCSLALDDASAPPVFDPISLTVSSRPPVAEGEGEGEGSDGGDGEPPDEPPVEPFGCSCDSTSSPNTAGDPRKMRQGIGLLGFFVGIFAFVVRLVRHRRRQSLYGRPSTKAPPSPSHSSSDSSSDSSSES